MYKPNKADKTTIKQNKSYEGETIEAKVRRIINNKEKITDGATQVYTDRKEGVLRETNIRTDRFDVALEATDNLTRSYRAKREEKHKPTPEQGKESPTGGGEPLQATGQ